MTGTAYMGTRTVTESGKTCQRWDSQTPHSHSFSNSDMFPDTSVAAASNYCRNPGASKPEGPWCYTTDPATEWEPCDITACECRRTASGSEYFGVLNSTVNGLSCQRWDSQAPHGHTYINPVNYPEDSVSEAENYCRNPATWWDQGIWCYTTSAAVRWQHCSVPWCECKTTIGGLTYRGTVSNTLGGRTCQGWAQQSPHEHSFTDNSMFPDGSAENAVNYCRNPDFDESGGPWCYTTDPNQRWEYCDVLLCEYFTPVVTTTTTTQGSSTTPYTGPTATAGVVTELAGTGHQECTFSVMGSSYTGIVSQTVSGKTCQHWDSQSPHPHSYTYIGWFPEATLSDAQNYCRNPHGDSNGLWCFTTDADTQWEYCSVPLCNCKQTRHGMEYLGDTQSTGSGLTCQRWDSQSPHRHTFTDPAMFPDLYISDAANYCRNPDNEDPNGPWCYTTDQNVRWQYCNIDFCECKVESHGLNYQGHISRTVSGKTCQRWDLQTPHSHQYTDNSMYPDGTITAAENYCRNPDDNEPNGPWCFTLDSATLWEYCDVPICELEAFQSVYQPPATTTTTTRPPTTTTTTTTTPITAATPPMSVRDCLFTMTGTAYMGTRAVTESAKNCQRWDSQTPHSHSFSDNAMFPDTSVAAASNYCRNPAADKPKGPWCFTTDSNTEWEYCDIPVCECRRTQAGFEYFGVINQTMHGMPCQRWDSMTPHGHTYTNPATYPEDSISEAENYCRNPATWWDEGIWCYTTSAAVRWQHCNVPWCECKTTADGLTYQGRISTTVTGRTCQRWDSQSPHEHSHIGNSMYPDDSVGQASNFCRNPDFEKPGGPWCFTTDPNRIWEYCDIPLCEYFTPPVTTTTTTPAPSTTPYTGPTASHGVVTEVIGTGSQECTFSPMGTSYMGTVSQTVSGKTCQRWDSQSPHPHGYNQIDWFPESTMADTENYCRNPDGDSNGLWCFTSDANTQWEYCNVPLCNCKQTKHGVEYQGNTQTTKSGLTCQRWDLQTPHRHSYTDLATFPDWEISDAANYCRNPDDNEPNGPWCYTTDPDVRWQYCNIDFCECKVESHGLNYQGKIFRTHAGKTCQRWDSHSPHGHSYTDDSMYPDGSAAKAENYCRNPDDNEPNGPWCYTTDPNTRWQYCDIPICELEEFQIPRVLPPPITPAPTESAIQCLLEDNGQTYRGNKSTTRKGFTCQRWDAQAPHKHPYTESGPFPDASLADTQNYCRNPKGDKPAPWCYTTDLNTKWDICDIPKCGCKTHRAGWTYTGYQSTTQSGLTCQRWDEQTPHNTEYFKVEDFPGQDNKHNFCRNPDKHEPYGPWCYTTNPGVEWEYCDIPFCECKETEGGQEYGGKMSTTKNGYTCQRWDSDTPHWHRYYDICAFPDASLDDAANYCRNPMPNEEVGPWCFTTDPDRRWDYCDVPKCVTEDGKLGSTGAMKQKPTKPLTKGAIAGVTLAVIIVCGALAAVGVLFLCGVRINLPSLSSKVLGPFAKDDGFENPNFSNITYNQDGVTGINVGFPADTSIEPPAVNIETVKETDA